MYRVCTIVLVALLGASRPDSRSDSNPACPWEEKTYTGQVIWIQKVSNLKAVVTIRFTDGILGAITVTLEDIRLQSIQKGTSVQCKVDQVRSCVEGKEAVMCKLAPASMNTNQNKPLDSDWGRPFSTISGETACPNKTKRGSSTRTTLVLFCFFL